MSRPLSRRWIKKQLRYAAQGTSIGLAALLVIFLGLEIMSRLSADQHIGHRLLFAFVLFTVILVLLVYRFVLVTPKSRRRTRNYGAVTELSKDEGDKTKSA